MRIALIVEGNTEKAILPCLREFINQRLKGHMPQIVPFSSQGRIPKGRKLKFDVMMHLDQGYDAVIALTDVYTGSIPPDFIDASDAKRKMKEWVGEENRFYPHAAQFEFEAWLLPHWEEIKKRIKSNRTRPGTNPELVNHNKPPSKHLEDLYRMGDPARSYIKVRETPKILKSTEQLIVSINACPELKSFINTILCLCETNPIP